MTEQELREAAARLNLAMGREERWADIDGYEGHYQVSSLGRVRSLTRRVPSCYGSYRIEKGKLRTPHVNRCGYCMIRLQRAEQPGKWHSVHQLVARAFVKNPRSLRHVNHVDGDKANNAYWNLEWVTIRENNVHAIQNGLARHNKGEDCWQSVPVWKCSVNGSRMERFCTQTDAAKSVEGSICGLKRAIDKNTVYRGFLWEYAQASAPRSVGR